MLEIENFDNYTLVTLRGVLDDDMKSDFDDQLHPLIEARGARLVIDLSACQRITSAGITLLVTLTARANMKGGRVVFASPAPFVTTVFEMAKLDRYFDICETVDDAIGRVAG
jgi:anti-anti-sigma factor